MSGVLGVTTEMMMSPLRPPSLKGSTAAGRLDAAPCCFPGRTMRSTSRRDADWRTPAPEVLCVGAGGAGGMAALDEEARAWPVMLKPSPDDDDDDAAAEEEDGGSDDDDVEVNEWW